jgi:mono/diheme cytochrome c family protein
VEPGSDTARSRRRATVAVGGLAAALLVIVAAACGSVGHTDSGNRTSGKELFVKGVSGAPTCGSCHTLADAGTKGQIGPDLDAAFRQSRKDGIPESTIEQVVIDQIYYPTEDPVTGTPGMPDVDVTLPECTEGQEEGCVENQEEAAADIAAYVASVAGLEGAAPTPPPSQPQPTTPPETTPQPGGGTAAGKQVFASAGCGSCHTLADAGSSGQVGPNLDDAKPDEALVVDRVTNGQGVMPPFKGQLSDQQIQDVARYVSQVAGT